MLSLERELETVRAQLLRSVGFGARVEQRRPSRSPREGALPEPHRFSPIVTIQPAAVLGSARIAVVNASCQAGLPHPTNQVCCSAKCGLCGGHGCSRRPGGPPECCMPAILRRGIICRSRADVACILQHAPSNAPPARPPPRGSAGLSLRQSGPTPATVRFGIEEASNATASGPAVQTGIVASIPISLRLGLPTTENSVLYFLEQISNVQHYCCNRIIVHQNAESNTTSEEVSRLVAPFRGVIVNNVRLLMRSANSASPYSLMDILLVNYKAARHLFGHNNFSHVLQMTENERLVRHGLDQHVRHFSAGMSNIPRWGCQQRSSQGTGRPEPLGKNCKPHFMDAAVCMHDPLMRHLLARTPKHGGGNCYYGQADGSFYSTTLLQELSVGLRSNVDFNQTLLKAPPAEIYLPSFVMNSLRSAHITHAITYMDWYYKSTSVAVKLVIKPWHVEAVRNGTWPGVFAVKRVKLTDVDLRRLIVSH